MLSISVLKQLIDHPQVITIFMGCIVLYKHASTIPLNG